MTIPRLPKLIGLLGLLALFGLAACTTGPGPGPSTGPAPAGTATRTPVGQASPGTGTATHTPSPAPPTATHPPSPTPTPTPIELVVCQADEPSSLYLYGDDVSTRTGIFSALFDGPIDVVGYQAQPVILNGLPGVEAGTAGLVPVTVQPGELVVDAATGSVVPLAPGVALAQAGGPPVVYTGPDAATTVQLWAEFELLPDLKWADGAPLTADDSVFSFEIARATGHPATHYAANRTAAYTATDAQHVLWQGKPGWVDADFAQRFWTPLPRHVYGSYTAEQLLALPEANETPLGWGPFMAQPGGWQRGQRLTLVRNPNYFRAAEGLPAVDVVTFRFDLPPEQILAELASGGCHVAPASAGLHGQVPFLLQAQADGLLAPQFATNGAFEHLDFGVLPAEDYDRPAGNDLFADPYLRQAFALCLDRQALVDQLMLGVAEVPAVYVPASHPYFAGSALETYPFDPAAGRLRFEAIGWVDSDGDGVRERGRQRLSLTLATGPADNAFRQALVEAISAQLRANCQVEVVPAYYPAEELYALWPTGVLFGRQFDMGSFPWRVGLQPPCELYTSQAIPSAGNVAGANNTGWSNPEFDAACEAAGRALDEATRAGQHRAAQVIFARELPSLPLFFQVQVGAAGPAVSGYVLDPTASELWNVEGIGVP